MMDRLYTAKQLAEVLQIHPETVRKLGREGKLKRVKVGRACRYVMPKMEGRQCQ